MLAAASRLCTPRSLLPRYNGGNNSGENLNNGQQNQTYISNLKLRDNLVNLNKIIYLKESPNIILFHDQSETMILE
jgi:hypothetical protein